MRGWGSQTDHVLGEFVRRTKTQFTLLINGHEHRFKINDPESGVLSGICMDIRSNYISASEYVQSQHDHLLESTRIKKMIERVQFVVRTDQRITTEQWKAMYEILKGEQNA